MRSGNSRLKRDPVAGSSERRSACCEQEWREVVP